MPMTFHDSDHNLLWYGVIPIREAVPGCASRSRSEDTGGKETCDAQELFSGYVWRVADGMASAWWPRHRSTQNQRDKCWLFINDYEGISYINIYHISKRFQMDPNGISALDPKIPQTQARYTRSCRSLGLTLWSRQGCLSRRVGKRCWYAWALLLRCLGFQFFFFFKATTHIYVLDLDLTWTNTYYCD